MSVRDMLTREMPGLRRYALALCRDAHEAEDLVQECLSRAIAAAGSFREGGDVRAWLFSILHNAYVSSVRRARTRAQADLASVMPTEAPADQVTRVEMRQVLDALARLPQHQREAVEMIAVEEISYDEAARRLGVPVGTLVSRLGRGREALRQLFRRAAPGLKVVRGER
ncbi:MAG TPA: sigma-70 family RNA polymerase sigma factor [Azospirillaceae bacterium]|nr:sigma-70 family RNA polymerase sigma factor [Azospirillaceae bacterium]